jgi:hypothetical protein
MEGAMAMAVRPLRARARRRPRRPSVRQISPHSPPRSSDGMEVALVVGVEVEVEVEVEAAMAASR